MKTKFILPALLLLTACAANGNVKVQFESPTHPDKAYVSHVLISDMMASRRPNVVTDTISISGNTFSFEIDPAGPTQYSIVFPEEQVIGLYTQPGENLAVSVKTLNPLDYTIAGSELMDGISTLNASLQPIEDRFMAARNSANPSQEQMMAIIDDFNKVTADFVRSNPASPAAAFALLQYDGPQFDELYAMLTPEARQSILFPALEQKYTEVKAQRAAEQRQADLSNGQTDAPLFTLQNLDGKQVSLADFRGKWVVLDFWGSWCPWCIKGFPKLKEAYQQYAGKLEVIGVDCGDTPEQWKDAVKKYSLPWVNVYNPNKEGGIVADYAIQGYPTKVVIDPEGKIRDITTGEDPEFFTKLANMLK